MIVQAFAALAFVVGAGAPSPEAGGDFAQSSAWSAGDGICAAGADFASVRVRVSRSPFSPRAQITVTSPTGWAFPVEGTALVSAASDKKYDATYAQAGNPAVKERVLIVDVSMDALNAVARAEKARIEIGGASIQLTGDFAVATATLRSCLAVSLAKLGFTEKDLPRDGMPPRVAAGEMVRAFGPENYPKEAMRKRAQGRVVALVEVGPSGKARGCRMFVSSGNSALDNATCGVVLNHLHFIPAQDGRGQSIAGRILIPVTWGLPPAR